MKLRRRLRGGLARLALAALASALLAGSGVAAADPCLECHGLEGLGVEGRPLWMHGDAYRVSAHGRLTCDDCHKGVRGLPHGDSSRVRCDLPCHVVGASHEAVAVSVARGPHAAVADPPCAGCHRTGEPLERSGVESLCRSCHQDLEPRRLRYPDTPGAFGFWGHRAAGPSRPAPTCTDCHGAHGVGVGDAARQSCAAAACHPGTGEAFGRLFDHRGDPSRPPWGGAGPVALAAGAILGLVLLVHSLRGAS